MTTRIRSRRGYRRIALGIAVPVLCAAVGAGLAGVGGAAYGSGTSQAFTFKPTDDTYTSTAHPSSTYGSSTRLYAGTLNGDTTVTYLKFTVGGLPSGATVSHASLSLTRDSHHLPGTVSIAPVATGWSQSTLTRNNQPRPGAVLSTVHPTAGTTTVWFDVTSSVTGGGTYAFAVTSPVTNDNARFYSNAYASAVPNLKVTVSVPAASPSPSSPSPSRPSSPSPSSPSPRPSSPSPSPTPSAPSGCTVSAKLVPTCNILWGAAAGGLTSEPKDQALKDWEQLTGRTASVFHTYHVGDELFPTSSEIAMASDPAAPRLLFENWKPDYGTTFAKVASGAQDARIDKLAAYITSHFTQKFFLTIHHEPENDVIATAGSGMTATDYANMFRHTVQRLRADGVSNAVFVMTYMSYEKWFNVSWWGQLYPGDDVVDWIALDSYANAQPGAFHNGDFGSLLDRTTSTSFPGFYKWETTTHPNKPLALGEWGIYEYTGDLTQKPKIYDSVCQELANYPALKAMFYFDSPSTQAGQDSRVNSSAQALAAFKKIAADPRFVVRVP